jgi:hypothetical protein
MQQFIMLFEAFRQVFRAFGFRRFQLKGRRAGLIGSAELMADVGQSDFGDERMAGRFDRFIARSLINPELRMR